MYEQLEANRSRAARIPRRQQSRLPPGGASDVPPFGVSGGGWGSSWMVYILPYVDQGPLYASWNFAGSSGYTNATNCPLVNNLMLAVYRCPSSPVPKFNTSLERHHQDGCQLYWQPGDGNHRCRAVRLYLQHDLLATANPGSGFQSDAGVLYTNSQVELTQISDGTSNTILVAEQSNHLLDREIRTPLRVTALALGTVLASTAGPWGCWSRPERVSPELRRWTLLQHHGDPVSDQSGWHSSWPGQRLTARPLPVQASTTTMQT